MNVGSERLVSKLSDPTLAAALSHFVRARIPEPDVQDIVQSTLTEALDAEQHPDEDEDIVRWVYGICRHKVIDWFRRSKREVPRDLESGEEGAPVAAAESAPQSAMDLLRWAKKELPAGEENEKTLEWMLREGEGEKLETIAAEANVPAPRVRQRVSRLRRYYKARWAAQTAALAALLLIALALALSLKRRHEEVAPAPGPSLVPTTMPTAPPTAPEPAPTESPAMSTTPEPSAPPLKPAPTPVPTASQAPSTKMKPPSKASMPMSDPTGMSKPVPQAPASTDFPSDFGGKKPRQK